MSEQDEDPGHGPKASGADDNVPAGVVAKLILTLAPLALAALAWWLLKSIG